MTDEDIAAAGAEDRASEAPSRGPRLFGFLGQRGRSNGSVTDQRSADGPIAGLPFGQITRVCGVRTRDLGTEVARSGPYRLHDSAPSSVAPRPQFITGFTDGCARQFTAALALFGTSDVHEATRYNPLNASPYSETDTAYEKVKSRVCGVRRGQPCPPGRADRLARNTAFVSVYRGFGYTGDWLELFLHDGDVAAYASRTN